MAACIGTLEDAVTDAPPVTHAGLVALFAAVLVALPQGVRAQLRSLEHHIDPRLAGAARLAGMLGEHDGALSDPQLQNLAGLDEDAAGWLEGVVGWPRRVRAAGLARELSERVADSLPR